MQNGSNMYPNKPFAEKEYILVSTRLLSNQSDDLASVSGMGKLSPASHMPFWSGLLNLVSHYTVALPPCLQCFHSHFNKEPNTVGLSRHWLGCIYITRDRLFPTMKQLTRTLRSTAAASLPLIFTNDHVPHQLLPPSLLYCILFRWRCPPSLPLICQPFRPLFWLKSNDCFPVNHVQGFGLNPRSRRGSSWCHLLDEGRISKE